MKKRDKNTETTDKLDISVIIPTYNRYELLKRAIRSVYNQSYTPKEIIVVDDGSCDNTSEIQKDFENIIYIYQQNRGVSSARNTGIRHSGCSWIAFLDSDDEWDEDKLKKQYEFHTKNQDILISYTDELWVRDGKVVKVAKKYRKYSGDIFKECLSHCIIAPSSVLIQKKLLEKVGLFDEGLEVCEDYDLWLRIASVCKIGLVDEKLTIKYAGHGGQLGFKYWGMDRFRVLALQKLLDIVKTEQYSILIKQQLYKKYTLLLKGAIKYDRISDIKKWTYKLESEFFS